MSPISTFWRAVTAVAALWIAMPALAIEQCNLQVTHQGHGPVFTTATWSGGGESLLLVGEGAVLSIYNIANAAAPVRLGEIGLSGLVTHLAVRTNGTLVAVSDGRNAIRLVNISNRSAPVLLGTYNTPGGRRPLGMDIAGDTLFTAVTPAGLAAIDISNPAAPVLLSQVVTPNTDFVNDVKIRGTRAYVADDIEGITVWNVQSPAAMTPLPGYDAASGASNLFIDGSRAYVARRHLGYDILDISGNTPTLLGSVTTVGSYSHGALVNGHLVTAAGPGGMRVFNIANIASPQLIATVSDQVSVNSVIGFGNRAFVPFSSETTSGLRGYTLATPASPSAEANIALRGASYEAVAHGGRVYVPQYPRGISVYDNAAATRGALLGRFDALPIYHATAAGTTVYATSVISDVHSLHVLNAANPAAISQVTSLPLPGAAYQISTDAGFLYVTLVNELRIYSIANPTPTLVGTWQPPVGAALHTIASGNRAYVGGSNRLYVLDIAQRSAPVLLGQFTLGHATTGLALAAPFIFLADGTDFVRVLNVANPAVISNPANLDIFPGISNDLALSGQRLYVAAGPLWGTLIADISNPLLINRVGNLPTPASVIGVAFANDTLIAAEDRNGVRFHQCPSTLFASGFE